MKIAQLKLPKEIPGGAGGDFTIGNPAGFGAGVTNPDTLGGWVSFLLPRIMILGGVVLFVMLLIGGFEILTSVGNQEKAASGAARIKNALIGFLILLSGEQ